MAEWACPSRPEGMAPADEVAEGQRDGRGRLQRERLPDSCLASSGLRRSMAPGQPLVGGAERPSSGNGMLELADAPPHREAPDVTRLPMTPEQEQELNELLDSHRNRSLR